jgi:hypothetical protein
MNDMKSLPFRILLIASMTFLTSAAIIRLAWALPSPVVVGSLIVIILLMFAVLGVYALILYLTIKPSQKKLTSLPLAISATVILTGALTGATVHTIRFITSPGASSLLSLMIASLLQATEIIFYVLLLWVIWKARKTRRG